MQTGSFHLPQITHGCGITTAASGETKRTVPVLHHFNYAMLTMRASSSCGNLIPCVMHEHSTVLIGEPTGGGSYSM